MLKRLLDYLQSIQRRIILARLNYLQRKAYIKMLNDIKEGY